MKLIYSSVKSVRFGNDFISLLQYPSSHTTRRCAGSLAHLFAKSMHFSERMCQGASTGKRLEEGVRVLQQSGGCHAPGCPALGSEIALGLKRDQRGEDAKPSASFEAGSLWKGGKAARPSLTFQRGKGNSQDPRGVLGRNAEPTGTDGFRFLSHQFFPSSLHRLGNCISRSNRCSLMVKPLTPVLLRWVANGDQGQNTRNRAFPALPLSVVENSDFSPTRLTGQETRLLLPSP